MTFGENLKKMRTEKGLSLEKIADNVYVSRQMLYSIEHGIRQPSLNIALAVAKYLGTTVDEMCRVDS